MRTGIGKLHVITIYTVYIYIRTYQYYLFWLNRFKDPITMLVCQTCEYWLCNKHTRQELKKPPLCVDL